MVSFKLDERLAREIVGKVLPDVEEVLQKYTSLLLEEYRIKLESAQSWQEATKAQGAIEAIRRIAKVRDTSLNILKG